ncbi:hypothetical protein [Pseudozobellia thermophila]|uniref:Uncharacterized protein n=1 Tax=Pseudozobellia thermophila TaxID=192903 RepID=A0A1M6HG89_9FLAO|nr:hypothetical protein [Pseudozobellia thermophila]SHJ21207.1 hypothetical protein SAMN04488513_10340 [Pseudozobellia thermophila]
MKVKVVSLMLFMTAVTCFAQDDLKEREKQAAFDPAYTSYSRKKPAYVTLKDGTKLEGDIKDVDRKKGQIYRLKISVDGEKKVEIMASDIADLYMAPSGLEQLDKQGSYFNDATKWGKTDAAKHINKGYTMYTNQMVSLKNKKKPAEYLMQVVNPKFSQVIQVFSDPFAKETMSIGVGSLKLAGGIAKSYYVKKGESIVWLTKSNFDEHFERLFMDNEAFRAKYADHKYKWSLLGVYVLDYTEFSLDGAAEESK